MMSDLGQAASPPWASPCHPWNGYKISTYLLRTLWGLNEIKRSILPLTHLTTNDYDILNHSSPNLKTNSLAMASASLPYQQCLCQSHSRGLRPGTSGWTWGIGIFTVSSGHVHRSSPCWPFSLPWCPLSYIAWSVSPPYFQGGNRRGTFLQALQEKNPHAGQFHFAIRVYLSKRKHSKLMFSSLTLSLSCF